MTLSWPSHPARHAVRPAERRSLERHGWKRKNEPRALSDPALALDAAFVLADDAVGDRQAESRPLADGLRRKERIVDSREVFARNPRSRIGDLRDRAAAFGARA